MRGFNAEEWEARLRKVFDRIDDYLEGQYGGRWTLHPARARRGKTSSKSQDGLFNVGAVFTPGYGSEHGAGYVVQVQISTLEDVSDEARREIEDKAARRLREELAREFPDRELNVDRDGPAYKIYGDLSL